MLTAQNIARALEKELKVTAFTFALQDGKQAGQTVPVSWVPSV